MSTLARMSRFLLSVLLLILVKSHVLINAGSSTSGKASTDDKFHYLGCYNDGTIRVLPESLGDFIQSTDPVSECAKATQSRGYKAFGVQAGGECWSGPRAYHDYDMYGESERCHGGTGGPYDNDVYYFVDVDAVCDVSLPDDTSALCKKLRENELRKTQTVFRLVKSTLGLFPILDVTSEQLKKIFSDDSLHANWMRLYLGMIRRNVGLGIGFLNKTAGQEFSTVAHYKGLYKFMVESQYTFIPPQDQKYFRFHFMRPGKPFKKLTNLCNWREDRIFTDQRLAGINPTSLQRVTWGRRTRIGINWRKLIGKKLNPKFDWKAAIQDTLGRSMSLYRAIRGGYVYALQYPVLDGLLKTTETSPVKGRELMDAVSPLALFVSKPSRARGKPKSLVPVAIQMGYTPDSKVYTPNDGDMWLLAKQTVQVADFAHLGTVEHLIKLHFFMEPICVCVQRHLHALHPLHQILKFHCVGVLGTNKFGLGFLVGYNGTVHKLFAIGYGGGKIMMKRGFEDSSWDDTNFLAILRKRGMLNKDKIPYFPYRDDGKLIYDSIKNMAGDYVNLYYKKNSHVAEDKELQNFANEVSADGKVKPHGGNGKIKRFPPSVKTKAALKDILTRLIWTTSAQHSAISYPSNYYGSYTPNMPTKLYNDPRVGHGEFGLYNLPSKITATVQSVLGMNLASFFYDKLFDYGKHLKDKDAQNIIDKHSQWINGFIRTVIESRNRRRYDENHLPYPYLVPGWIANSIHT